MPLFEQKSQTDVNYESLVRLLLETVTPDQAGVRHAQSAQPQPVIEAVADALSLPQEAGSIR